MTARKPYFFNLLAVTECPDGGGERERGRIHALISPSIRALLMVPLFAKLLCLTTGYVYEACLAG